jgi:hypothetical protein
MKKINFRPSYLQVIYLIIYIILFLAIIYIPELVSGPVRITKKLILEEELAEGILLGVLFLTSILILNSYKNESLRQKELISKINNEKKTVEERLNETFRYVGQINVQIREIKETFNAGIRFPETKHEFKKTLHFYSERVFGISDTDWVMFRIIDSNTQKTVIEHFDTRNGVESGYPHISNRLIIEKESFYPFSGIISNPQILNLYCCCILSKNEIGNEEKIFIQAITNEITMLFIIMNSSHSKEPGGLTNGKYPEKDDNQLIL